MYCEIQSYYTLIGYNKVCGKYEVDIFAPFRTALYEDMNLKEMLGEGRSETPALGVSHAN